MHPINNLRYIYTISIPYTVVRGEDSYTRT